MERSTTTAKPRGDQATDHKHRPIIARHGKMHNAQGVSRCATKLLVEGYGVNLTLGVRWNLTAIITWEAMMKENRSALWALIGVLVGFALPVLACIGATLILSLSLAGLGAQAAPSPNIPVHVSGPQTGPAVALIEIRGPIVSGRAPSFSTTSVAAADDIIALIRQAAIDSDVRAIVLNVNSPGGSVVPSDQIYHQLQALQIPVVVHMEDVAASGAYYLSMGADYLIANPNTLTGSIGVISTFPDAHELLEKIGVQFQIITAGEAKDFGSPYRSMEPEEAEYWQGVVDEAYQGFIEVVAQGRNMQPDEVRPLADGRLYTGRRALELDLIDELGYLQDAVDTAAALGGIEAEPRVIRYEKYTPLRSLLGENTSLSLPTALPPDWLQRLYSPALQFLWVP